MLKFPKTSILGHSSAIPETLSIAYGGKLLGSKGTNTPTESVSVRCPELETLEVDDCWTEDLLSLGFS